MSNFLRRMFSVSQGLRHELAIAFSLVITGLLAFLGYLFPGASSIFAIKTNLVIVAVIVFILVLLAFTKILRMVDPIIKISRDAKKIADGDLNRQIRLMRNDEIGELGTTINRMTTRIKKNMEELRILSEKTGFINKEINKRILVLSSLLQISNLISQNASFEEIIEVGVDRCLVSGELTDGYLILKERQTGDFVVRLIRGGQKEELINRGMMNLKIKLGQGFLGKTLLQHHNVFIDKNTKVTPEAEEFRRLFSLTNAVIVPIFSRGKQYGLLIVGNHRSDFVFSVTDREQLELLAKQVTIAVDNNLLASQVEKLETMDNLTGLYNATFAYDRLDEEIKRAISFQRPCAFALFNINGFREYYDAFGYLAGENALIKVGSVLKENIGEVGKAARFGDHEFALILPEKNKRQAIEMAEEIRRRIEFIFSEEDSVQKRLTCSGVVTENPLDGVTAKELISKAREILETGKKQGGNKILYKI